MLLVHCTLIIPKLDYYIRGIASDDAYRFSCNWLPDFDLLITCEYFFSVNIGHFMAHWTCQWRLMNGYTDYYLNDVFATPPECLPWSFQTSGYLKRILSLYFKKLLHYTKFKVHGYSLWKKKLPKLLFHLHLRDIPAYRQKFLWFETVTDISIQSFHLQF